MIVGINHITLAVSDIETSFKFYTDILGFTPIQKSSIGAYLLAGDAWIALTMDRNTRRKPLLEYTYIAFTVAQQDFDTMKKRIIQSGAKEWQKNTSEGDSFYFVDPNGHKLEIHASNLETRIESRKQERGDDVLRFVSKTFVANARPFDLYGRWGGEEFIGIIRNINGKDLEILGNRLRTLIENAYIIHEKEKLYVTISIGATVVKDNDTMDSLIKRAETLLYKSKSAGRNYLMIG